MGRDLLDAVRFEMRKHGIGGRLEPGDDLIVGADGSPVEGETLHVMGFDDAAHEMVVAYCHEYGYHTSVAAYVEAVAERGQIWAVNDGPPNTDHCDLAYFCDRGVAAWLSLLEQRGAMPGRELDNPDSGHHLMWLMRAFRAIPMAVPAGQNAWAAVGYRHPTNRAVLTSATGGDP